VNHQPRSLAQQNGCQQAEAFCLMLYRDTAGNEEWIWNSRDGVTHFIVQSRQGLESKHVEWTRDRFLPYHFPKVGERIFVDTTPARARERAETWYDRFAAHLVWSSDFVIRHPDREKAITNKAQEILAYMAPNSPDLIEVTEEVQQQIMDRPALVLSREKWAQLQRELLAENANLAQLAEAKAVQVNQLTPARKPMRVTITPTASIVQLNDSPCRVWTGTTERGIPVTLYVTRVQVDLDRDQSEFLAELTETEPPKIQLPL